MRLSSENKSVPVPDISEDLAKKIGDRLKIDWEVIDLQQFRRGIEVELEHGSRDSQTDVTHNDLLKTGKIAWAHLKEVSDYYTKLKKVEGHKTTPYLAS